MMRAGAFIMMILVVMLTTLSLLPHHHHECSDSAICMLPYNCGHEEKCAHNHDTPLSDKENCMLKLIDISAINKAEKNSMHVLIPFIVFIVSLTQIEIFNNLSCNRLIIYLSEKIFKADYTPFKNLRAPPAN